MNDIQVSDLLALIELQQAQINGLQDCADKFVEVIAEIYKTLHLLNAKVNLA